MSRFRAGGILLLACLACPTAIRIGLAGQSISSPTELEFTSGGNRLIGRFFPSAGPDRATVLLLPDLPGSDVGETGAALELGPSLSSGGLNVLSFNYRGTHRSEGDFTLSGADQDIDAARRWLGSEDARGLGADPDGLVVGGYGFGGGMAMAYSSSDLAITKVFSIAGLDLTRAMARYASDPVYADALRDALVSDAGAVRWERDDFFAFVKEAMQSPGRWDLHAAAPQLARKRLLLVGGLDDAVVPVEEFALPLYRVLRGLGTQELDITLYQSDHSFSGFREDLTRVLTNWITR